MYLQIFIQALAILGLVIWAASYHFKKRKNILLIQLSSFVFWIAHFILLEAYTGAALATVAALRLAIFSFKKKNNWISKPLVFWSFIGLLIISTILTFSTFWSLFALAGGIFAIIASWQENQNRIRMLFIPSHLSWIIYDLLVGSYGGALSEAILGISAIISLRKKNK
ncbi:MAG: YgjV family protein [Candidatus Nanoarchaeia archaeon]|nr:YgjV family protein [Candidatus Nanoarchaeia archaeon]